ncbi:MAG: hypothetical protein JHC39_09580 [Lentimicrobium sp.]|jgi:hypothetical protein|nr:hypothetical protein [Lentimicrobium sp.]
MKSTEQITMKTIAKLALLVTIMMVLSCSDESVTTPLPQNSAAAKLKSLSAKTGNEGGKVTRPIVNALQSDDYPGAGPLGGAIYYGTMSHLGEVHGIAKTISVSPDSDGNLDIINDEVTVAANGDKLFSTGSIKLIFPSEGTIATITGGSVITGGTGRFNGATGYFIFENMTIDLVTGHESHTAHGEITY